jgi:glycosyltransferase involved in cell wall biosynthesis
MKTKYCVLYPEAENVHLIKDVGMIAYKMYKLFNYEAFVACYENDSYEYLDKEVKGLKLSFIENKYNNHILDGMRYLRKNAKKIDVLQLFHITLRSVFYSFIYKFFNPKGKIFLKLDCTERLVTVIKSLNTFKLILLDIFLNKVDIIGVEQEKLCEELTRTITKNNKKLLHLPNGIDFEASKLYNNIGYNEKENIILHVSRIGSPEKATDIFLEAISRINNIEKSQWKVNIVGPIDKDFKGFMDDFFAKHNNLKSIIEFKGAIFNREQLFEEYQKAKVFCLSSNFESFGIALLEAASFGDIIISTDVGIAKEIVSQGNGAIVNVGDAEALSVNLTKFMADDNLEALSKVTASICKHKFNWDNIVEILQERLMKIN